MVPRIRHSDDVITPPVIVPVPLIAAWCCDSWPKLNERTRKLWRKFLASGVIVLNDYREKLNELKQSAKEDPRKTLEVLRGYSMLPTYQNRLQAEVVDHDGDGKILLAIDPHTAGAAKQVEQVVQAWRKRRPAIKRGKARIGQWGDVISEFEQKELTPKKAIKRDDQLFARYYRIIRGKDLGSDGIGYD